MRWIRPVGCWATLGVLWVGIPLSIAQTLASPIMAFGLFGFEAPHKVAMSIMPYAWSYYLWCYPHNANVQKWALWSAAPAGGLMAVLTISLAVVYCRGRRQRVTAQRNPLDAVPDPIRAQSAIYGKARWMDIIEAEKLFPKPGKWGGIPILELNRVDLDPAVRGVIFNPRDRATWGQGGKGKMLLDPMVPGQISSGVIFGGSGIGKSSGFTKPALVHYLGSMVVNDPSGKVSHSTAAYREDIKHRVAIVDPHFPALGAFNILKTIDINDPFCEIHIKQFVAEASGEAKAGLDENQQFFAKKALALNTALLADLLFDPAAEHTVREWRRRIITPEREMKDRLRSIYAHTKSDYARDTVGELMDTYHETSSGIRSHATGDTEWLSLRPFADLLSEDTFDPAELIKGRMTIYTQFDSNLMKTDPQPLRCVMGSLMRTVMRAKGRVATNIPFVIDETYQMKHMDILAVARDEGRHFRMPLYTMWQSEGQLEQIWGGPGGAGKKPWFNSAAWRMYMGGVDDPVTAKELSTTCGTYTVLAPSEGTSFSQPGGLLGAGRSTRGNNNNLTLQARHLCTDSEFRTGFRLDETVAFFRGQPPARFGIAYGFQRDEDEKKLKPDSLANQTLEATP